MTRPSQALALVLTVLAGVLVACGDDGGGDGTTAAGGGDLERYCEISAELDAAGQEEFEALEKDPKATQEDFEAAERRLVEDNEELLEEIQSVAPAEIASDVKTQVEAVRARAGLTDGGPSGREEQEAELAINDFEQENCPSAESPAP